MFNQQYLRMVGLKLKQIRVIFKNLEVVGRDSETQLQVGENVDKLTTG